MALVVFLLLVALIAPVWAADTVHTVTLSRIEQAALEWRVVQVNKEALAKDPPEATVTPAQHLDAVAKRYFLDLARQTFREARDHGVEMEAGAVVPLPVVTGNVDLENTNGSDICNFTLTSGAAPTKNFDSRTRCTAVKDTANRLNLYWDVATDRYLLQNKFAVTVTVKIGRID